MEVGRIQKGSIIWLIFSYELYYGQLHFSEGVQKKEIGML